MRVSRTDRATFGTIEKTSLDGIRVPAFVSRTGVLQYSDTSGKKWGEYRPPEEVFSKDSLASIRSAPVTVGHPDHLVTPKTYRSDAVGHACDDVRRDGDKVAATLVVQDADTIAAIDSKALRELSAGYECDIDPTPGVAPDGTRYDAIQRNIRVNHIAVLPPGQGRSGPTVALRMDGAAFEVLASEVPPVASPSATAATAAGANQQTSVTASGSSATSPPVHVSRTDAQERTPMKLKIGSSVFDLTTIRTDADMAPMQAAVDSAASTAAQEIAAAKAASLDAYKKIAALEATLAMEEQGEAAAATEPADDMVLDTKSALRLVTRAVLGTSELKGKRADAVRKLVADAVESRINAIETVRKDAREVLGEKHETKGKSVEALRLEVLAKIAPSVKFDSIDAKSHSAVYDVAIAAFRSRPAAEERTDALGAANASALGVDADGKPVTTRTDADEPAAKMVKDREAQAKAARERAMR